jgi:hypothetical protein
MNTMMNTITLRWLTQQGACPEGKQWFREHENPDAVATLESLIEDGKLEWANWLIVRVMERKQYLQYAVFAAEQVIDLFEREYPSDERPRKAIEAVRRCIEDDSPENRDAAWAARAAGDAAGDAAWAARAAGAAAWAARAAGAAAGDAAWAARAAGDAAWAAGAAGDAAGEAAWAAGAAGDAAGDEMQKRILVYGMSLLREAQA